MDEETTTQTVEVSLVSDRATGEAEVFSADQVRFLPLNVPLHLLQSSRVDRRPSAKESV